MGQSDGAGRPQVVVSVGEDNPWTIAPTDDLCITIYDLLDWCFLPNGSLLVFAAKSQSKRAQP